MAEGSASGCETDRVSGQAGGAYPEVSEACPSIIERQRGAFLSIRWPDAPPTLIPLSEERRAALAADAARVAREAQTQKLLESSRSL